ncbi:MAG: ATP-binding protein [Desulfobacterales bacterium]|nr:ATP-binding protein [Desulfobacterales bacterium]
MSVDLKKLFRAFNPKTTLDYANSEDRKFYVDFSSVRSEDLIREWKRTIINSDEPTCQLFTGHIGTGKSTELLRLKTELEEEKYHVVYFRSSRDLDMGDIDITDILLQIARNIYESLSEIEISIRPGYFSRLFGEIKELLQKDIDISVETVLNVGIAKINAKTKDSPKLRSKLRDYLEARTDSIIDSINNEIIEKAVQNLEDAGKKNLVVIVDNLDRMDNTPKPSGRTQPEHVFIDRGEHLQELNCHLVYTIPMTLIYSNNAAILSSKFGDKIKVLPMNLVQFRDGSRNENGIDLFRQMVMKRVFPDFNEKEHLEKVELIFESPEILDRLCILSGGHVRNLLRFIYTCLQKEDPPLTSNVLENVIRGERDDLVRRINSDEWTILQNIVENQYSSGDEKYHTLLRTMFAFEHQDETGVWFGINPLLMKNGELIN